MMKLLHDQKFRSTLKMQRGRQHAQQYKHLVHGKIYMYILAMYMSMCSGLTLDLVVWVPQSPLGRYHVRYFQGTSG
jgi:hypothetical protein